MAQTVTEDAAVPSFMLKKPNDPNKSKLIAERIVLSIPCLKDKYVAVIHNAFSNEECKELIELSENIGYKDALVNLGFGYKETMNEFRNHQKISIDHKEMANYIFNRVKLVIPNQFNNRKIIDINERLRFLRYSSNEYFGAHYDGMYVRNNGQRSLITIVLYLSDNYNGGEFTFLHPTNMNKTHSIKPQTGMILLFEQNKVFHEGSIVLNNNNNNDAFKYCIRSDIMYSKELISESISNNDNNPTFNSYEVEKQKVYFERNASLKSSQHQPNTSKKHKKMSNNNFLTKIIYFWFNESYKLNENQAIFPNELYEEIAKYCRIIGILDYVCDPNELCEFAKVSESAERYQDMVELMTELVMINSRSFKCKCTCYQNIGDHHCGEILNVEQRKLLSVAYQNVVGSLRASWRTLNGGFDDADKCVCDQYKRIVERELHETCTRMLDLLENYIVNKINDCKCTDSEALIFYMKMIGDYNRYLAEFMKSIPIYEENAEKWYSNALKIGKEKLKSTHPTLMGLSLNYAVYLYEIAKQCEKACIVSKTAFDNAIENLNSLNNNDYKDSTLIMRLLRDNLTLWTSNDTDTDNNNNNNNNND